MSVSLNRRMWLKTAGIAAIGAGLASRCSSQFGANGTTKNDSGLAKVKVSSDRIIRTTIGLRPVRQSGFVLKSETVGEKTVIHNYGHGGSGMSLSWGTAHLAVEEARRTGQKKYAVLGAGVVGLSTARLLQRQGYEVTIYAKDLPPRTTSNMSAAWFGPTGSSQRDHTTPEFADLVVKASRLSYQYFQEYLGQDYGVHWTPAYAVSDEPPNPEAQQTSLSQRIADLYPESTQLEPQQHPFPRAYVRRRWTMQFEPAVYLNALMRDYRLAGGQVIVTEFENIDQILTLDEPVIVNCTGLGSKNLFGDEELQPAKGQLTLLLPQPEINYMVMLGGPLYMLPRSDGIVLGGSREVGEWSLEPNPAVTERAINSFTEFFGGMA